MLVPKHVTVIKFGIFFFWRLYQLTFLYVIWRPTYHAYIGQLIVSAESSLFGTKNACSKHKILGFLFTSFHWCLCHSAMNGKCWNGGGLMNTNLKLLFPKLLFSLKKKDINSILLIYLRHYLHFIIRKKNWLQKKNSYNYINHTRIFFIINEIAHNKLKKSVIIIQLSWSWI